MFWITLCDLASKSSCSQSEKLFLAQMSVLSWLASLFIIYVWIYVPSFCTSGPQESELWFDWILINSNRGNFKNNRLRIGLFTRAITWRLGKYFLWLASHQVLMRSRLEIWSKFKGASSIDSSDWVIWYWNEQNVLNMKTNILNF